MARITVKVHPRAKRSALAGKFGETWKLDLAAPPVDGKANEECVRFLAEMAGVPRARVRIVTGASLGQIGRIEGLAQDALERLLAAARARYPPAKYSSGGPSRLRRSMRPTKISWSPAVMV